MSDRFDSGFSMDSMRKDVRLAKELAERVGVDLPHRPGRVAPVGFGERTPRPTSDDFTRMGDRIVRAHAPNQQRRLPDMSKPLVNTRLAARGFSSCLKLPSCRPRRSGSLVAGADPPRGTGRAATANLVDPATGKVFLSFADAGPTVIDTAMDAAQQAQASWLCA